MRQFAEIGDVVSIALIDKGELDPQLYAGFHCDVDGGEGVLCGTLVFS